MSNVKNKKERQITGKRLTAALLVAVMLLAMLPTVSLPAFAASDSTTPYRIVMLDCGRKYFSVENIKKLIDTMSQYGYNQLTLAFGNGGCRFLLDDMSLLFGSTTMTSDIVRGNITEGNETFNGDTRYLTQSEMDTIITYANGKGIEIVPLLNMPGHADAILYRTDYTSNDNLNVNDETSRNYGYALLGKYVNYFKGKGCKYFHFGADESGFSGKGMTTFLAGCAKVITDANMTPRMFNDPADGTNTIPNGVEVTYWYKNDHLSASSLSSNGYKLINTHGRWYYVIKSAQNLEIDTKYWQGTVNSAATSVELPVMKAEKMDKKWVGINEFFDDNPGYGSTITESLGTMFCIWCDASQDTYLTDSDVMSENEKYGVLYQLEKLAEHYWKEDIKSDSGSDDNSNTSISISADNDSNNATVTVNNNSITANIATNGKAVLAVKNASGKTVTATSHNESVATAAVDNNKVTITPVHQGSANVIVTVSDSTSAVATYAADDSTTTFEIGVTVTDANTVNVSLNVGDSKTFENITADAESYITNNDKYIATAEVTKTESTRASVNENITSITSGSKYLILPCDPNNKVVTSTTSWGYSTQWTDAQGLLIQSVTINNNNIDNLKQYAWTITQSGDKYTVQNSNGKYLNIFSNNALTLSETEVSLNIGWNNGKTYFKNDDRCYLNDFGGEGLFASGYVEELGNGDRWTLYEIVEESTGGTTLTINGVGEGTTSVTVGNTNYNIAVTAPSTEETKALTFDGNFTPTGTDVTITSGNDIVSLRDDKIVAGEKAGEATVTSVVKNDGGYVTKRYTYKVTVSKINFNNIADLNVQLWITNTWVGENEAPDSLQTVKIKASDAYSESGVLLENFVPGKGYKKDGSNAVKVTYWKGSVVDTQPDLLGSDLSGSGDDFTLVRYWEDAWQYYGKNGWTAVVDGKYVIAYYVQINNVSPEIVTATKDYGNPPTSDPGSSTNGFALTAFAVVYPDGTLSRTEQEMYETGMMRGFWDSTEFGIGLVFAENNSTYKVSKMTVTWGTNITNNLHADGWYTDSQSGAYGTGWGVKWNKVTNSAGVEWYDETVYWQAGGSDIPTIDGDVCDLKFNTVDHHAVLILIYLETVETDDSLKVIYWDDASNIKIPANDIFIDVKYGNIFYNGLTQTSNVPQQDDEEFALDNDAYIENKDGVQQKFNTEISTVPGVSGTYLSGMYIFDCASFDDDGKTMVLHYRLANSVKEKNYVVDFGLPVEIQVSDFFESTNPNIESISLEKAKNTLTVDGDYGTAKISDDYTKVTYELFNILPGGIVTIPLYIKFVGGSEAQLYQAHIYPASTVYYEEEFLTFGDGWQLVGDDGNEKTSVTRGNQTTSALGDKALYGYDEAYKSDTGHSGGSAKKVTVSTNNSTATASFKFTGTGFDIMSVTGANTGSFTVKITGANNFKKNIFVDTYYGYNVDNANHYVKYTWQKGTDEKWHVVKREELGSIPDGVTLGQRIDQEDGTVISYEMNFSVNNSADTDLYQIPVISCTDLEHGEYTVTINAVYYGVFDHQKKGSYDVYIDGVRIYNTRSDSTVYEADGEDHPTFTEIRDILIGSGTLGDNIGTNQKGIVFIDGYNTTDSLALYDAYGPNNEVYLNPGQAIAFKVDVTEGITYYIGAKSPNGDAIMVINGEKTGTSIATATDMYYPVTPDENDYIVVANNGEGILSLTTIKAVGGDAAAVASYSVDEDVVAYACAMVLDMVQPAPAFEPETFETSWTTIKFFSFSSHTLSVRTSDDVEYITVGEREVHDYIYTYKFEGSGWNRKLVKYKLFTLTLGGDAELGDHSVVAYNAEGNASAPKTATLTGNVGVGKFN